MKTLIFFNNKGGVGKTTLVYHVGYMLAQLGKRVVLLDLDPQMNLTSMLLTDQRLLAIYDIPQNRPTIMNSIRPVVRGIGDINPAQLETIAENLHLLPGDLDLSGFEDRLSDNWTKCLNGDELAFRTVSVFYRVLQEAVSQVQADYCLIDVGPNFGAINRATLIAADHVIIPMAADLFSLQGLKNVGATLTTWRREWADRRNRNPEPTLALPDAIMRPSGYIVMQHAVRDNRPVKAYTTWANRIPGAYSEFVLGLSTPPPALPDDPNCLAILKHYRSLMPMAMEARKPIFLLNPSDGAIGAHYQAVKEVYSHFKSLCERIIRLP
ncbi:ParA family protein [Spirosoma montaniterrae]|uniref:Chromosome partitioning protein n=1 Tax=Spirosoma montaniterrae TaxID=1178516 RepID=A0A1P9WW62_9BACT|nr:AAA family ATPase [Spirosoma montaniterrae]AQG79603.1 chromosome partitioning protein [Spirosoma montaniterrae]